MCAPEARLPWAQRPLAFGAQRRPPLRPVGRDVRAVPGQRAPIHLRLPPHRHRGPGDRAAPQGAAHRGQAPARARHARARLRLRLGQPRPIPGPPPRCRRHRGDPVEGAGGVGQCPRWPSSASPTVPASCTGTIARSRAASTGWSRSACSSMSACASTRRCSAGSRQLLPDDGVALVHSIGRVQGPGSTNAWISKYIFPGGYIPALSQVLPSIERSGLWVTDIEILRLHYAHTLRQWRERFAANWDRAAALYDERFCRMWEYYLATSEVSFRYLDNMNFQIQLAPDRNTLPLARDYMIDEEPAPALPRLVERAAGWRRRPGWRRCGSRPTASNCTPWPPARPMGSWSSCCTASRSSGTAGALSSAPWPRRACAWSPPTCAATTCLPSPRAFPPTCWTSWPTTSWAWPMPWAAAGSPSSAMTGAACWPGTWPRVTPAASSARPSSTHPTPPPCATSLPGTRASSPAAGTSPFPAARPARAHAARRRLRLARQRPHRLQPSRHVQRRRPRPLPPRLVAARRTHRDARLVPCGALAAAANHAPAGRGPGPGDLGRPRPLPRPKGSPRRASPPATGGQVHHLRHASHWVQHEEPGEVNRLLAEFTNLITGRTMLETWYRPNCSACPTTTRSASRSGRS